jgi:hypothetical protein
LDDGIDVLVVGMGRHSAQRQCGEKDIALRHGQTPPFALGGVNSRHIVAFLRNSKKFSGTPQRLLPAPGIADAVSIERK